MSVKLTNNYTSFLTKLPLKYISKQIGLNKFYSISTFIKFS